MELVTNFDISIVFNFRSARNSRTKVPCLRSELIQSEVERSPLRLAMKNRIAVEPAKSERPDRR